MFNPSRILILAPHTDDGELGCGGSIVKFCEEKREVFYAAFSACEKSLPAGLAPGTLAKECEKATAILGIKQAYVQLYDFEVRVFPKFRQEILEELIRLKKEINPELVFTPSAFDIHQDHQVIHAETLRAFKNTSIVGYELPWNQTNFHANFFIRLSEDQVDKKVEALKAYHSQQHRRYFQNDFVKSLATIRGTQANTGFAETFEIYRWIV
jgi:LmbE family N-acetylglucosaminyl deacetylase